VTLVIELLGVLVFAGLFVIGVWLFPDIDTSDGGRWW